MSKWTDRGNELIKQLKTVDSEKEIKALCDSILKDICDSYENISSRKKPLDAIRKAVRSAYPATKQQTHSLQFFTNTGKGRVQRYEHLAIKYLTFTDKDWNELGDEKREQWKQKQQQDSTNEVEKIDLTTMTLEQLGLSQQVEDIARTAMQHLDISLNQLLEKAITSYSKTVVGKVKKDNKDLSNIPTDELLESKQYSTHPKRPEELVKRAIRAISIHNSEIATENADRWCITQSIIVTLTGSRASKVGKLLEDYKTQVDDHNKKYELNAYSNRKPGKDIREEVDLVELVPDGIG